MYSKNAPMMLDIEKDETVYICQCGKTQNPPYCDGSHRGTGKGPYEYTAKVKEQLYLCRCGKSSDIPFCDGSHQE